MDDNKENNPGLDQTNTETPEKPKGVGVNGNLIPPKPGEVRNPNGKAKGTLNRATLFNRILEQAAVKRIADKQREVLGDELETGTIQEQVIAMIVIKALEGDMSAAEAILNNSFGKMADKIDANVNSNATVNQILKDARNQPGLPSAHMPPAGGTAPCPTPLPTPKGPTTSPTPLPSMTAKLPPPKS